MILHLDERDIYKYYKIFKIIFVNIEQLSYNLKIWLFCIFKNYFFFLHKHVFVLINIVYLKNLYFIYYS